MSSIQTVTTAPRAKRPATTTGNRAPDQPALWRERTDERARAVLVRKYMPLARSLARRYERSSEPLEDLVQVAALGLLKAIDRFDPDRGVSFAAFAVPTMLGELRRYFRDCCWNVHVPRGMQERVLAIEAAQRRLPLDRSRAPSVPELAEYLELDVEQVLEALQAAQAYGTLSLDAPRKTRGSEEDAGSYADVLGEPDERFELIDGGASIAGALQRISPRERTVLVLRFRDDLTQSEIAKRIGVSQMQVSRLLRSSLEQLRMLVAGGAAVEDGDA